MGDFDWAEEGHCVTLISAATPDVLITALGGRTISQVRGIDAVAEHTVAHWGDDYDPGEAVIGVADVGAGWSLAAEVNGYLGVTERVMGPLSGGRTIVSHFRNINAVSRFHWWRDGRLLVDFDLLFPDERFGAEPDALLDAVQDIGADLTAAGFALAERITGLVCTPEMFEQAEFSVAVATMPGHDEQERYGDALRDGWSAPAVW